MILFGFFIGLIFSTGCYPAFFVKSYCEGDLMTFFKASFFFNFSILSFSFFSFAFVSACEGSICLDGVVYFSGTRVSSLMPSIKSCLLGLLRS